jgi:hypothetical protein
LPTKITLLTDMKTSERHSRARQKSEINLSPVFHVVNDSLRCAGAIAMVIASTVNGKSRVELLS